MEATLRLFKALPLPEEIKTRKRKATMLLRKTIQCGFVFSSEVINNYTDDQLERFIDKIGLNPEQINSTFHKSWKKVKNADIDVLVIEQILHYITTYGFERLGIYDKDTVFIPNEVLNIPSVNSKKIPLVVIKGYTKKQLKEKLLKLLSSGIALKDTTCKDVIDVATFVGINEEEVSQLKNKEVKVSLYDYLDMFPRNPVEFLRYLVYKTTNQTLLIKNDSLIKVIKEKDNLNALKLFEKYETKFGLKYLAEIFFRYKPIFLAFRVNRRLKTVVNKIRKLANIYHKPMPEDFLNTITEKIKKGEEITKKKLDYELKKASIFRKIRLAYALEFRGKACDSILYRIRNGKSYATDFSFPDHGRAKSIAKVVSKSIADSMDLEGKKIYLPRNMNYALPATEKMFTGQFPTGSYVSIPKDMVFGIHWNNVKNHRIDLDLSLISAEHGKVGWDGAYRSDDRKILFSGDVTDAPSPNGASELFYVAKQTKDVSILFVNYYNYSASIPVPFDIVVAKELVKDFRQNYMLNPNNIIASAKTAIDKQQKMLGLLITTSEECRFYFVETAIGKSITSSENEHSIKTREFLLEYYQNAIQLKDIVESAGAIITSRKEQCDIDLSPETLEKDTIINLLTPRRAK